MVVYINLFYFMSGLSTIYTHVIIFKKYIRYISITFTIQWDHFTTHILIISFLIQNIAYYVPKAILKSH